MPLRSGPLCPPLTADQIARILDFGFDSRILLISHSPSSFSEYRVVSLRTDCVDSAQGSPGDMQMQERKDYWEGTSQVNKDGVRMFVGLARQRRFVV